MINNLKIIMNELFRTYVNSLMIVKSLFNYFLLLQIGPKNLGNIIFLFIIFVTIDLFYII
jgi:hypothetical protein